MVDDLDPCSVSGFGRLGGAGVDGGLTGFSHEISRGRLGVGYLGFVGGEVEVLDSFNANYFQTTRAFFCASDFVL